MTSNFIREARVGSYEGWPSRRRCVRGSLRVMLLGLLAVAGCSGAIGDGDDPGATGGAPATGGASGMAGADGRSPAPGQTPPVGTPPGKSEPPPPFESLFACNGKPGASPARLWRLTAAQFDSSVRALSPGMAKESFQNPFSGATSNFQFANYAESFGLPAPVFDRSLNVVDQISGRLASAVTAELPCAANPDAACVRMVFTKVGARAFRRPMTTEELDRYGKFVEALRPSVGGPEALRQGYQAMLSSPHFLFRVELGADTADGTGRRKLTPHELASALSYTLTDAPPDAMLAAAASAGTLATAADLAPHVQRLLGEPADSPVVQRFLTQSFEYDGVLENFKDPKDFPNHNPQALLADTQSFVKDVVRSRKDVIKTLLSANWGYVGPKSAFNNNLETMAPKAQQKVTFAAGQRAGLLTQPSFLTAFSHNDSNDPIARGKFIAINLLCLGLPNEPPEAVPPLPDDDKLTMREKLAVHRTSLPSCKACHDIMDNLGLAFETYDHTGRFRTMEGTKPADGRGAINGAGVGLDGPFADAIEMTTRMAASPRVEQCFVRQQFRYLFGRDEREADACSIAGAFDAYRNGGGDLAASIASLLTSDSFLYRTR